MTRVRLSEPVAVGQIEFRVIERTQINMRLGKKTGAGLASKEPIAILIQSGTAVLAFDPGGEQMALEMLALQYPELGLFGED
jgi:hypothetical protein